MTAYTIGFPTPSEMATFHEHMQRETERFVHLPDIASIVRRWGRSMLLFSGRIDGETAALFGICDPVYDQASGYAASGQLLLYVYPAWRGRHAAALCRYALHHAQEWFGFTSLKTLCRPENKAMRVFLRHLKFVKRPLSSTSTALCYSWEAH